MNNETVNMKAGCVTGNSMTRTNLKPHKLQRPYSNDELTRIEQLLSKQGDIALQVAVWLGAEAGLRLREICSLTVSDVDLSKRNVFMTGTTRDRYIPFSDKADYYLRRWLSDCGHDVLLYNVCGKPLNPHVLSMRFRRTAREAGIHGGTFHRLRHTMVSNLLMGGLDVSTIMAVGGWTSSAIPWCKRFAPVTPERVSKDYKEAMSKVYAVQKPNAAREDLSSVDLHEPDESGD